jgi:hypothetical protein
MQEEELRREVESESFGHVGGKGKEESIENEGNLREFLLRKR